jgi:hypothetical protein
MADCLEDLIAWSMAASDTTHWLEDMECPERCVEIGKLFKSLWTKILKQPAAALGPILAAGNNDESVLRKVAKQLQDVITESGVKDMTQYY